MAPGLCKAVGWSVVAMWIFGLQNYIIGYTNSLPGDDFNRTVGLLWLATGLCGAVFLCMNCSRGVFFADSEGTPLSLALLPSSEPPPLPLMPKVVTVAGGIAIGGAQLFMKLSFAADPEAMGPLASVVCADVILVSLLCHFFYNERLTPGQWGSVALVFAGLVTMAGPFGGGGGGVSLTGFGFAVCAMLCFGASVFSVRVAAVGGLSAASGFIARTICMGVVGVLPLLCADWSGVTPLGVALPMLCGLLQASGVYAINEALGVGPYTSIAIAIFGSNSVVVLLLSAVLEAKVPPPSGLFGMGLTGAGCITISLFAKQPDPHKSSARCTAVASPMMSRGTAP